MITVVFTLRASSQDKTDTAEQAEKFCQYLKDVVLGLPGLAERHQIKATVEYTVAEVEER